MKAIDADISLASKYLWVLTFQNISVPAEMLKADPDGLIIDASETYMSLCKKYGINNK